MIVEENGQRLDKGRGVAWAKVLQCGALLAVFLYLYAPILSGLIADWWDDPNYSHGFLVPLLSAYFAWQRREKLAQIAPQTNWWGMVVLLGGLAVLLVGNIGAEYFLMRSSMIMVITGLVLYLCGLPYLRTLAFPIAFLLFMIPLPAIVLNKITFPLQLLAARLSTESLQFIGFPVYREGNIIFLPHTTLEVVEACSGIRSLVSLTALAVVFAYMTQRRVWKRVLLVISAIPIAIVANAFRIWGTGVLAHLYGTRVAEGFYHSFAGWMVFVAAFGMLLVEGVVIKDRH